MDTSLLSLLVQEMGPGGSNGKDEGAIFPRSDEQDVQKGALFIPSEITDLRREGGVALFIQPCKNACCWFWQLSDGSRIYHFERSNMEMLDKQHGGVCPECGNDHLVGQKMTAALASRHRQKIS